MNVLNICTASLFLVTSVFSPSEVHAGSMVSRRPIGHLSKALKKETLQIVLSGAAWLWSSLGRGTVSCDQGSTTGGNYDYVDPEEDQTSLNQALLEATYRNDLDSVKNLLSRGANELTGDKYGNTPYWLAVFEGHLDIVKYLIEVKHVDAAVSDIHGTTALMLTIYCGHLDIVKYLIEEAKVDANASDSEAHTAIYWADRYGYMDIVEYLIFKGAIVTSEIIDMIVIDGNVAIIETMMKAEFERRGKKDAQKILMRYMVLNLCLDKKRIE